MSEWLSDNLAIAYPFSDSVTDPALAALFADALITSTVLGPYTLTAFDPQAITNGVVTIMAGATTILSVTTMTGTTMGTFTVLRGADSVRGSSFTFIVDTAALASYPALLASAIFVPDVTNVANTAVTSLNGLAGDVVVAFNKYITAETVDGVTTLTAVDPADRVTCPEVTPLLTLNGQGPDQFGSMGVSLDGCMRVIPNPAVANQLILADFCAPCIDTATAVTVNDVLASQADYFYHLAAIYVDQFNRYQQDIAQVNTKLAAVNAALLIPGNSSSAVTGLVPDSIIDLNGRSYNRPYSSQLVLGITNSSPYEIRVALTVTVTGFATGVITAVPNSGSVKRFLINGAIDAGFSPFPGSQNFALVAREVIAINSEVHVANIIAGGPAAGLWNVVAVVTFITGPGTLPSTKTFTKTFPVQVIAAEFTKPPATTS